MFDKQAVLEFIEPYYADKDIMHNMWHVELMERQVNRILEIGNYEVCHEKLLLAMYFHGFIYKEEAVIREWLSQNGYEEEAIEKIVTIAWESQRSKVPDTIEGKILNDAHVLEGGETYTVVKTLITGSVRGQSLTETMDFMEKNVLGVNKCYLPETISLCEEMNRFTNEFFKKLKKGIR